MQMDSLAISVSFYVSVPVYKQMLATYAVACFFVVGDLRLIVLDPPCVFNLPECSPLSTKGASKQHS
jgi:hypothetical protein